MYKIDLANLVSKYIGETEKNLGRLFDAAEAANVVLFLDEADALLGKRSEVSDAHDRYANIEVAYLLQRLERYEGIALLATNLAKNIDPAFMRRLHVLVEFPFPGPAERRRIWADVPPQGCAPGGRPRPRCAGRPVRAGRGDDPQRRARRRLPGRRGRRAPSPWPWP